MGGVKENSLIQTREKRFSSELRTAGKCSLQPPSRCSASAPGIGTWATAPRASRRETRRGGESLGGGTRVPPRAGSPRPARGSSIPSGAPASRKSAPLPSDSNPEPRAGLPVKAAVRGGWREAQPGRRGHLPLPAWPAAGGQSSGFAKRGGGPGTASSAGSLGARAGGSSTRPESSANKAQRGPGGETGGKGEIHPRSSPLPGAGDRWSRAPPRTEAKGGLSRG